MPGKKGVSSFFERNVLFSGHLETFCEYFMNIYVFNTLDLGAKLFLFMYKLNLEI